MMHSYRSPKGEVGKNVRSGSGGIEVQIGKLYRATPKHATKNHETEALSVLTAVR